MAQRDGTTGLIEMMADRASHLYVWRRPITFEVRACGRPNIRWDFSAQKFLVCHEMAADYAHLYRDYVVFKDVPKVRWKTQ